MSFILLEYLCPGCGSRHESLEVRASPAVSMQCPCGGTATRAISAPRIKLPLASVERGRSDPPPPGVVDTRPLAEGMSTGEWKARRRRQRLETLRRSLS